MKAKLYFILLLSLLLIVGCAAPPKKERMKLPSQTGEPIRAAPAEEPLKELVVPQREEAKKIQDKLFTFYGRDVNIQDILLAFSRESDLNIVLDPELSGKVTIDLKRVTLKEALDAILSPLGWTYRMEGTLIKVYRPQMETRLFTLNYIATKRSGKREVYASTGGGLQSGATLGQQTGGPPGQQTSVNSSTRTGYSDLVSVDEMDLWKEIHRGLEVFIFGSVEEKGGTQEAEKATFARADGKGKRLVVHRSSGVILVTDYPINLNKIAAYLEMIEGSSQRQVTIQAKIVEVILSDDHREGINWKTIQSLPRTTNLAWGLTDKQGTTGFPGGPSGYISGDQTSGSTIKTPSLFRLKPYGGILAFGAGGADVVLSDIMQAISEQGNVKILSSPTLSTLNNQKAIIRVGNQDVFFVTGAIATQSTVTQIIQPMTIDIGIILDLTPQIAEDGTIIMNIHPSITEKTGEKSTPDGKTTFPLLSVRETDTTVRVKDGQTIIIAGLMSEKIDRSHVEFPWLRSLPLIGGLFKYKSETKKTSELVIMITPTLQIGKRVEDLTTK